MPWRHENIPDVCGLKCYSGGAPMQMIPGSICTSHADDDLASGLTFDQVSDGRRGFAQGVRPVEGGHEESRLDEISEDRQVLGVLRRDKRAQLLAHQWGQQEG